MDGFAKIFCMLSVVIKHSLGCFIKILESLGVTMEKKTVLKRYFEKFGYRIAIHVGCPDIEKYFAELERCIDEGTPFDHDSFYEPLPDNCIV